MMTLGHLLDARLQHRAQKFKFPKVFTFVGVGKFMAIRHLIDFCPS